MCKVTRNARSVLLNVRQGGDGPPALVKNNQHVPIESKAEQCDEKLAVLPQADQRKDASTNEPQLVDDVRQQKENGWADESASADVNASLRAISALCLPEAPNVLHGPVIRECLLGQVSRGSYVLGANQFLPIVVKEFNVSQVLSKTTKHGRGLHEDALAELQIHAYIQKKHIPNVIGLYGMHLNKQSNKLSAYLEYAAKGELFSIVQERGAASLPVSVCGNFLVQLLQGIDALHSINVVHRDLSLENVLLTEDNQIKICDFGLATICAPGVRINDGRVVGKVNYMCPELYYHEEYDPRLVDIWSAAVIFFLLLTGIFPYERPSAEDPRLVMLCHGRINEMLAHWKRPALDQELIEVFTNMFCPPQERWTAQQLLQMPFCQRYANLSNVDFAAAWARSGSSDATSAESNPMSEDSATPSLCSSTNSHSKCSSGSGHGNGMDHSDSESVASLHMGSSQGSLSQLRDLSGLESSVSTYAKEKSFLGGSDGRTLVNHAVPFY